MAVNNPNRSSEAQGNQETAVRAGEGGCQVYPGANLLEERDRQWRLLTRELQELDRKIRFSEGYRVSAGITFLEGSYFVFDGNYLNLKHVLDEFEQPAIFRKLLDERASGRLTLFIKDVARLFHNCLAGAATLLDHTHVLTGNFDPETGFADEFDQQVGKRFRESSLPHFVEDLRNYTLHNGLLFALSELSFGGANDGLEVDSAIRLDVSELRNWEEWSEKGREYLNTLDNRAKLEDIVNEYTTVVADFYKWFRRRQSEVHSQALEELEELESKREHLREELRRLGDPLKLTEKAVSAMREEHQQLIDELESERKRHEQLEQERLKLQQDVQRLEDERKKGFWRCLFGR